MSTIKHKGINQIQNCIDTLKTNPDSRRIMVNAWNVQQLKDMTLPPCHFAFQFYTEELTMTNLLEWCIHNTNHIHWPIKQLH